METGFEKKSLTYEDYQSTYKPLLERVAQLTITHPDIPEDLSDLTGALNVASAELEAHLQNKVPEFERLQAELVKKTEQVRRLQDQNVQLNLMVRNPPKPEPESDGKPKLKTWQEIKAALGV